MRTGIKAGVLAAAFIAPMAVTGTAAATVHSDPCPGEDHIQVWSQVGGPDSRKGQATNHFVCAGNLQGPKGDDGEKGDKGETGATGAKGDTGATGPAGATGATGPAGAGLPGPQGTPGPQGPQGDTGATGSAGVAGPSGATGAVGPVGPEGPQGDPGQEGLNGETGATGPQGPKGDSAFITSFDFGGGCEAGGETFIFGTDDDNPETENSAVTICNGEDGSRGPQGEDGARGLRGAPGTTTIVQTDGTTETVEGLPATGADTDTTLWLALAALGLIAAGGMSVLVVKRARA